MNIILLIIVLLLFVRLAFHIMAINSKPTDANSQKDFYQPFFDFIIKTYNIGNFEAQIAINKSINNLICLEYTGDSSIVDKFFSNSTCKKYIAKMLSIYRKELIKEGKFEINAVFRLLLDKNADPLGIICCGKTSCDYWPLK